MQIQKELIYFDFDLCMLKMGFAKTSSEKKNLYLYIYFLYREEFIYREEKGIDSNVYASTKPMTIHDSIIESIQYRFQMKGMLW